MKKKGVFLFLIFVFVFLLIPQTNLTGQAPGGLAPGPAAINPAGTEGSFSIWGWLGNKAFDATLGGILKSLIFIIALTYLTLANLWVSAAAFILEWVMSPDFISLSYTGLDNPIIKIGWDITRDLANMGIVLALIAIGLATILRLESYQAKKTLPLLIIVALLINFAPVILGVIVDASNILMNHFLKSGSEGVLSFASFTHLFEKEGGIISDAWYTAREDIPTQLALLGQTSILVVFAFITGFIFFLFAALFAMRYIAIWIAVILSPLAFVAYILPKTRAFFDMWWKQFLSWCLIGVIAAFFIYLSVNMIENIDIKQFIQSSKEANIHAKIISEGNPEEAWGMLNTFLPYGVMLGFLLIGLFTSIAISAMGANTIVSLAKRGGKAGFGASRWVARRAWKEGIRPNIDKGLAKISGGRLTTRSVAGSISHGVEKIPVARWFMPEPVRKYGQYGQAIDKAQANTKEYKSGTLVHRMLKGADIEEQATANLLEVLQRGDAQDVFNGAKDLGWGKTDEEILNNPKFQRRVGRAVRIAADGGKKGQVLRRDPRLAVLASKFGVKGYAGKSAQEAISTAVKEARGQHITDWEPEILHNKFVSRATLAHFDRDRWLQINRTLKNGQETALHAIDSAFSDFIEKEGLSANTEKEIEGAWKEFAKDIEKEFGMAGYFKAVEEKRMQNTGWRKGKPKIKNKRWWPLSPQGGSLPVGETSMGSAPPDKLGWTKTEGGAWIPPNIGKKEKRRGDTGQSGKRKR